MPRIENQERPGRVDTLIEKRTKNFLKQSCRKYKTISKAKILENFRKKSQVKEEEIFGDLEGKKYRYNCYFEEILDDGGNNGKMEMEAEAVKGYKTSED